MSTHSTNYSSFRKLEVWRDAIELVADVYRLTESFPTRERYGLTSQIRRASVSVPANIAEGYGRATRGEYLNLLSVARGSLNEVETLFLVCMRLGVGERAALDALCSNVEVLQKRLTRLRSRLAEKKRAQGS
jgi:four helix bundle protein